MPRLASEFFTFMPRSASELLNFMPRSASGLSYYFNVIRIIYASFGIRIIITLMYSELFMPRSASELSYYSNVIRIIYASVYCPHVRSSNFLRHFVH